MVSLRTLVLVAFLCSVSVLCLFMSVVPCLTGGRLGIIAVCGDSMAALPYASRVLVLPFRARPGDIVTAWGSLDGPESADDNRPCLLVKLYDGRRLVSTASGETCSKFQLRGRVTAVIPVQKLCPRLCRRSSITPSPLYRPRSPEEQERVLRLAALQQRHLRRFLDSGDARWHALDNTTVCGLTKQVRVLRLPEPCVRIAMVANAGPQADVRVYAGQTLVARFTGAVTEIMPVTAPAGRRLDRLVLTITPNGMLEQHVTLVAVRKLEPGDTQLCRRVE